MNLNIRISGQHIEFEPNTYYASFSGELEAAASILWAMVSHLKDNSNNAKEFSANVIRHCLRAILEWMEAISYRSPELVRNLIESKAIRSKHIFILCTSAENQSTNV